MTNSTRLSDLRDEYQKLWDTCQIKPSFMSEAKQAVAEIFANRGRYEAVAKETNVPWYFISIIHNMECSLSFTKHIHNGDSLKKRTWQVPANRPPVEPKNGWRIGYTWEESAIDSLKYKEFDEAKDWTTAGQLWRLELYNGMGYRLFHPEVKTPYLWSGTNHYNKGKYTQDGRWDANAVSQQIGAAPLLKLLLEKENNKVDLDTKSSEKTDKTPERRAKGSLIITNNPGTFLKESPLQAAVLDEAEKEWLENSRELPVLAWRQDSKHLVVTFHDLNFKGRNTWYVFSEHCHIKAH